MQVAYLDGRIEKVARDLEEEDDSCAAQPLHIASQVCLCAAVFQSLCTAPESLCRCMQQQYVLIISTWPRLKHHPWGNGIFQEEGVFVGRVCGDDDAGVSAASGSMYIEGGLRHSQV